MLKIRLRQQGRKNRLAYRLVISDSRSPRDGKYVEMLGWYHPCETQAQDLDINAERVAYWLSQGAQFTQKAEALVAKAAPEVVKEHKQKLELAKLKKSQKRKSAKKKAAS